MGATQTQLKQSEDYLLVEELPVGNIVKHNKTQVLHFLKEYSFTAQEAYQNALNAYSLKLANKNEHVLNFMHFKTKSQNSFCSTFHKIILIFQYIDYSLEKEIANRIKDNRPFNEKEMWSVLCSCVLAAVHLIHCEGKMHCGLTSKDIKLSPSGCVKLLSHQMIGIDSSHSQNQGVPKTLALTLIECMNLEKVTNQDNSYLEKVVQQLQCSRQMKDMLLMMIKKDVRFTQLEEHLFKLVQDDESLASQSNTPLLKSQSPLNSNYKCPRIQRNQDILRESKSLQQKFVQLEPLSIDYEDPKSYLHVLQACQIQVEIPDETQQDSNDEKGRQIQEQQPQQADPFFLKQRKMETNIQTFDHVAQDGKAMEQTKITKSFEINTLQSSRKRQNQENMQKTQGMKNGINLAPLIQKKGEEHLFTDPKLFSLIKSDLEQIKMRRSIGQLERYKRAHETSSYLNNQQEVANKRNQPLPIIETQNTKVVTQTNVTLQQSSWFSQQQNKSNFCSIKSQNHTIMNGLKSIQMIKQVSQEYQEEDQAKTKKKNSLKPLESKHDIKSQIENKKEAQKVQNILNDNQIGFRKKKESTGKFQVPKQNVVPQYLRIAQQKQKIDSTTRPLKAEQNIQSKSKTVGMKPGQVKVNYYKNQELFDDYSRTHSAISSHRVEKIEKEDEKLVQVNEKYNRGRYEGTKLNGKRHGYGTFYYSEGGKYVGNWKENKMHGKGVLYYPNQQIAYDGEWQNDQLSGYGTLYNQQVTPLKIPFDYRDWNDVQDYWVKYEGQFYQDNKQGHGKLYLVNGQRLEGEFHDDKVDGQGVLYRGDGSSVKGKWRQNKLIRLF